MRPHSCPHLSHPLLIISNKMSFSPWLGRVPKFPGWICERSSLGGYALRLFSAPCSQQCYSCRHSQPKRGCSAHRTPAKLTLCRMEPQGWGLHTCTSKCLGKECKTRRNTKFASCFLQFACRTLTARSILVLGRLRWIFPHECA